MELRVERSIFLSDCTIGKMYADGVFECFTLEPTVRPPGVKVPGKTAIPEGRYQVIISPSPKFGFDTPHVMDVPDFSAIEMHIGNFPQDTEGCTLVGKVYTAGNSILESKDAFHDLMCLLTGSAKVGGVPIFVTYENILPGEAA